MIEWLMNAMSNMGLSEEAEGYLLGRGLREDRIHELGIVEWKATQVGEAPAPEEFAKTYGAYGASVTGLLAIPVRAPSGKWLGIEFRSYKGDKRVRQFRIPEAEYAAQFAGMAPSIMEKVWNGADIWVVEGLFDLAAMEHVVPARDVVLGTFRARVSRSHVDFFSRFCRGTVHMVYDRDETGRNMTNGYVDSRTGKRVWGALDSMRRVGIPCRDVPYMGGKDPGEIWDSGGIPALKQAFDRSIVQ